MKWSAYGMLTTGVLDEVDTQVTYPILVALEGELKHQKGYTSQYTAIFA